MTERSLGESYQGFWHARVLNVANDRERSGRALIRIFGLHDNVEEALLPWARPLFPINNPSHMGVATPQTGLVPGSIVVGFWADRDRQIPIMTGTLGRVGTESTGATPAPTGSSAGQPINLPNVDSTNRNHDFPVNTRGGDHNQVLNRNIIEIALERARFPDLGAIGSIPFQTGQSVYAAIQGVDPNNLSGSIQSALNGMNAIQNGLAAVCSAKAQLEAAIRNLQDPQLILGLLLELLRQMGVPLDEMDRIIGEVLGAIGAGIAAVMDVINRVLGLYNYALQVIGQFEAAFAGILATSRCLTQPPNLVNPNMQALLRMV